MIRSKHKKLEKYTHEYLARHFCGESYDAHDALEDVKMLSKIVTCAATNDDYVKSSYDANNHFLQENFNRAKTANLPSLHVLVGEGIVKMGMAENIAGSGLNFLDSMDALAQRWFMVGRLADGWRWFCNVGPT